MITGFHNNAPITRSKYRLHHLFIFISKDSLSGNWNVVIYIEILFFEIWDQEILNEIVIFILWDDEIFIFILWDNEIRPIHPFPPILSVLL